MKKHMNSTNEIVKKLMMNTLKRDANSTTCFAIYQPKVPTKLENFKKGNNV